MEKDQKQFTFDKPPNDDKVVEENMTGWNAFGDVHGHQHLIPGQKKHRHYASTACWCEPWIDEICPDTGREIWRHHVVQ